MKKVLILFLFITNIFADIYATYEVQAQKEASLNLAALGIVSSINVEVSNKVKKGEILLVLDDAEEKANFEISKNNYHFLLSQYERYKKSAEVFDKNTLEKLKYEVKNAQNIMLLNEARLSKMKIIAPFSGIIAEKNIEIGDMSNRTQKALLKLVSNDTKLLLAFDSKYSEEIKLGDIFCLNEGNKASKTCVEIYKIYPTLNNDKKLNAEAYGVDLKIGNFGDGYIRKKD